jgi:hypothetical protein
MRVRFLIQPHFRVRPRRFMAQLQETAARTNARVFSGTHYVDFDGLMVVYGAGRPETADAVQKHRDRGQRSVCWDVGYWGKGFRLALDGHHPAALPQVSGKRPAPALREEYDPAGPIILVGMGPKSRHMAQTWEHDALERIRAVYPDRRVIFRPKPNRPHPDLPDVEADGVTEIEDLLRGASLIVCRHSNVGVDACIAGIPVVAEAGAPALLYGNDLANPVQPTPDQRRDFLARLAWLNWRDEESMGSSLWDWIVRYVGATALA